MKKYLLGAMFFMIVTAHSSEACTNFRVNAKDKSVVIGRTMEFPIDLQSKVRVIPRAEHRTSHSDKGLQGLSWTARYAYIGINGFGLDATVDGMNEAGLAYNALMYSGAQYQDEEAGNFVTYADLGAWILGNFATVAEVKKNLPQIKVTDTRIRQLRGSLGMHIAVHDAAGNSIVVEFLDGRQVMYDNTIGVLTNRPSFDQQLTHLRNYVYLDARDKSARKVNDVLIAPTGAGSGMFGLPGDWTPPSRFARIAFSMDAAFEAKNAAEAINLAEHLINIVDIPRGVIKEHRRLYPLTQWAVIADLANKIMYFRTYDNMSLRKVSLLDFDLSKSAPHRSMPISQPVATAIDVTELFEKQLNE